MIQRPEIGLILIFRWAYRMASNLQQKLLILDSAGKWISTKTTLPTIGLAHLSTWLQKSFKAAICPRLQMFSLSALLCGSFITQWSVSKRRKICQLNRMIVRSLNSFTKLIHYSFYACARSRYELALNLSYIHKNSSSSRIGIFTRVGGWRNHLLSSLPFLVLWFCIYLVHISCEVGTEWFVFRVSISSPLPKVPDIMPYTTCHALCLMLVTRPR